MKKNYEHYNNVTREILDTIKVGDFIRVNNWKKPMRVKAVSDNYFVMIQNLFGNIYYSVCSKLPWDGVIHNSMRGGMFHCSTDNWIFGSALLIDYPDLYKFENEEANQKYLQQFEDGESELSERRGIAIYDLYIKRA
jgi:hypothetical protein